MKDNLISTKHGIAIILAHVSFGYQKAYRIRLTENSISPGRIIAFYPIPEAHTRKQLWDQIKVEDSFF